MSKREAKRFIKRLEVEFEGRDLRGRGITSDISRKGLFIRTQKALAPGTPITIRLHLSDGTISTVKGIVRRAIKVPIYASEIKNGMGVEIREMDSLFETLIKELEGESPQDAEYILINCPSCGVKNKVLRVKLSLGPRCGRCGASLMAN